MLNTPNRYTVHVLVQKTSDLMTSQLIRVCALTKIPAPYMSAMKYTGDRSVSGMELGRVRNHDRLPSGSRLNL